MDRTIQVGLHPAAGGETLMIFDFGSVPADPDGVGGGTSSGRRRGA